MGRPKNEDLMLMKWRFYFKTIMDGLNTNKISVNGLLEFAMVNPTSNLLCDTMEDGIIMANKAIESIKNEQDNFLKYDSKQDAIIKLSIEEVTAAGR